MSLSFVASVGMVTRAEVSMAVSFLEILAPAVFRADSSGVVASVTAHDSLKMYLYEDRLSGYLRKPQRARLSSLAFTATPALQEYREANGLLDQLSAVYSRPISVGSMLQVDGVAGMRPQIRRGAESSYIKEICVPFASGTERQQLVEKLAPLSFSDDAIYGIFRSPQYAPAIRLFPSFPSRDKPLGLTLRLPEDEIERLRLSMRTHKIGSQIDSTVLIHSPLPLDLRVTSSHEDTAYYLEGLDGVLEGTLQSLQSKRVSAGDGEGDQDMKDPRINAGHCWSEAREISKRPWELLRK